jgi:hypothetical protein
VFTFRYAGSCFPWSMVVCKVKHKSFKSSKWRSQWPTLTLEQWGQTADSPCCTRRSNRKLLSGSWKTDLYLLSCYHWHYRHHKTRTVGNQI